MKGGIGAASLAAMSAGAVTPVAIAAASMAATTGTAQAQRAPASGGITQPATSITMHPGYAQTIAQMAYLWGWPMVNMINRRNRITQAPYPGLVGGILPAAPRGQIGMLHDYIEPSETFVTCPNQDVVYGLGFFDLDAEPVVIQVPDFGNRFWVYALYDQRTDQFGHVGKPYGTKPGFYLLAGPKWNGEKPKGIRAVIPSETEFAFVLYRTQLFNPGDIDYVKKIQAGYKVQTLSAYLGKPAPASPPAVDFPKPLSAEQERSSLQFFNVLNFLLQFCPTVSAEKALMTRFAKIGVGAGKPFDANALSPEMRKALQDGMADAWATFNEYKETQLDTGKKSSADAFGTRQALKNNYLNRMSGAALGIYGNSKQEAMYPAYFIDAARQKLDGASRYTLRFAPQQLPPVNAFWSLTMYELPASLLYANPLNRYLINSSMLPSLKRDADGGITLYIQNESPGTDKESNWLPAPKGPFFAAMRLYWPKPEALDGKWKAPLLQRTN
jgi:hypothetical protein